MFRLAHDRSTALGRLALALVLCGFLLPSLAPTPARALGLSFTTPPGALTPFKPGAVGTTTAVLAVTSVTSWTLTVSDAGTSSPAPGHLLRSNTCSLGVAYLSRPLSLTLVPTLAGATSSGAVDLSGSNTTVASGTGANSLNASFNQTIGAGEALQAGCVYSVTVTFTLS